jgi:hypothetical protein
MDPQWMDIQMNGWMNGRLTAIVFLKFKNHIKNLKGVGVPSESWCLWNLQVGKTEIWTDYKMTNRKKTYVNEHMNKQIDGQMNTQMGGPTDRWTDNELIYKWIDEWMVGLLLMFFSNLTTAIRN